MNVWIDRQALVLGPIAFEISGAEFQERIYTGLIVRGGGWGRSGLHFGSLVSSAGKPDCWGIGASKQAKPPPRALHYFN